MTNNVYYDILKYDAKTVYFGEKEIVKDPIYDIKKLDKAINRVSKEARILDTAIKHTNAVTEVIGYTQNESVLGEIE